MQYKRRDHVQISITNTERTNIDMQKFEGRRVTIVDYIRRSGDDLYKIAEDKQMWRRKESFLFPLDIDISKIHKPIFRLIKPKPNA